MQGFPNLPNTADSATELPFTSEDLKIFTDNFNKKNLIGNDQFGKLYRGQMPLLCSTGTEVRNVTVKIWDQKIDAAPANGCLIKEEVKLSAHPSLKDHPNMAKLIGYCFENEVKGIVYDLNPLGSLQKLMENDDINWLQRVDVILELARLLDFLHSHENQNLVFNFSASNILLDWECKPKLCGFGLISNGTVTNPTNLYRGAHIPFSYSHPYFKGESSRGMSFDVYSFGEILLGLMAKRNSGHEKLKNQDHQLVVDSLVNIWAKNEYKPNTSLVHRTLQEDWGYSVEEGIRITELAMHCLEFFPNNRPSTKQIVQSLENLPVTHRLSDIRPRKKERKFHFSETGI